jgi:tRNA dimethylallyltransferase
MAADAPLVVITGPTASGKTSLAVELALQYGGEIICADSRTVFRGMDIGTAKPTLEERAAVPHWGLDIVDPGERFTAADFARYARDKIEEIRARGNIPFLVGGTGLYVDAVLFGFTFGPDADEAVRAGLEEMTIGQLVEYCQKNNINLPENSANKRQLVRAIERKDVNHKRNDFVVENTIVVAIATEKNVLRTRIAKRVEQLLADGVVKEAIILGKKYGWQNEAMTGNIYRFIHEHIQGTLSQAELAKRQLTWMRRNPHIMWANVKEAREYIVRKLDI